MGDAHLRTIAVVTVARSDYGILMPVLREIERRDDLRLALVVGGMHLAPEFGYTAATIEADGFTISERVEMSLASDTRIGTATSIGLGVIGFANAFNRIAPDLIVLLGDRFEMHAAALAALPLGIPVAHIHGGEVTVGAFDESLRHGISKIAHLHFVSTEDYGQRLRRMGEEPWRITVSGAPSLDNLESLTLLTRDELAKSIGIPLSESPLLITWHPATLTLERSEQQLEALLSALENTTEQLIFTAPNADPSGRRAHQRIAEFATNHPHAFLVENLGTLRYFSLMRIAGAMVGNSSSGIIEAASFELPVVNVGPRQNGRTRAMNVIDVPDDENSDAIATAIARACSSVFRTELKGMTNPFGTGHAARVIVDQLASCPLDARLRAKKFFDG